MPVWQFLAVTWSGKSFSIFISSEKSLAPQLFKLRITKPKAVDKVKIRAERREMIRRTTDQQGKEIIRLKCSDPVGEDGKLTVKHEDKGTQDLRLVDGRSIGIRVEGARNSPTGSRFMEVSFSQESDIA